MTLIAFPAERVQRPSDERACSCGSTWFRLERATRDGSVRPGAVQVSLEGDIVAYSGAVICYDCGKHQ